ncbi:MAG: hypothetical protein ABSC18_13705, partial [Verrucomicrobiota bacterium]
MNWKKKGEAHASPREKADGTAVVPRYGSAYVRPLGVWGVVDVEVILLIVVTGVKGATSCGPASNGVTVAVIIGGLSAARGWVVSRAAEELAWLLIWLKMASTGMLLSLAAK